MKFTLLKTLVATSLVVTAHAQVHVLGVSFKERGVSAPAGTVEYNPGTVAAPRGYLIMDGTIADEAPNKATYIEYGEIRDNGEVTKYYTVNTEFTEFRADAISGDSGSNRLYGHMLAPVTIAEVENPLIPFSGKVSGEKSLPLGLSFDHTVFQTGASDSAAGPQIIDSADVAKTMRSVMSGKANPVAVTAPTVAKATLDLIARLEKNGYTEMAR